MPEPSTSTQQVGRVPFVSAAAKNAALYTSEVAAILEAVHQLEKSIDHRSCDSLLVRTQLTSIVGGGTQLLESMRQIEEVFEDVEEDVTSMMDLIL